MIGTLSCYACGLRECACVSRVPYRTLMAIAHGSKFLVDAYRDGTYPMHDASLIDLKVDIEERIGMRES